MAEHESIEPARGETCAEGREGRRGDFSQALPGTSALFNKKITDPLGRRQSIFDNRAAHATPMPGGHGLPGSALPAPPRTRFYVPRFGPLGHLVPSLGPVPRSVLILVSGEKVNHFSRHAVMPGSNPRRDPANGPLTARPDIRSQTDPV
jgi:hypothetical protein